MKESSQQRGRFRLTLVGEILVDKAIQGLGATALDVVMSIGRNVFAAAGGPMTTLIVVDDVKVIPSTFEAYHVYYSINQGARLRPSASIQTRFGACML